MKNTLTYAIRILENVSFDKSLFYKEFQKAVKYLLPYDLEQLQQWAVDYMQTKPELQGLELEMTI